MHPARDLTDAHKKILTTYQRRRSRIARLQVKFLADSGENVLKH